MNYTTQAQEVLKLAAESAKLMQHPYIGTEHLLIGLSKIYSGVAGQVLDMNGVKEEDMLKIMNELVTPPEDMEISGKPMESPRLQFILEEAAGEAQHLKAKEVGTEHLLLAVLNDADCVASRILQTLNVNMQKLYQDIMLAVGADINEYMSDLQGEGRKKGVLEQFGTDLTEQAAEGKLDPVIGREQEIGRLMQILSRRTKNNPCLVGEPGVGKTAVIEGLAQRISGGLVPEGMKEKKIFTMDLASMIAGSKYRGEFEERMKKLIQEVKAAGNVILFLDEVHTIIGAGGAEGAMDASNILKPSLARSEIQLIGATTIGEYRKYIEKDAALERRFQPVTVEEPTKEQCLEILEGLKSRYENHHHVTVEQEALESAVALSVRYVNDRFLPDKAIDVLDEACSKVSLRGFKVPDSIEELEQVIDNLKVQKEEAIREGNMTEASTLHKEQIAAEKKLDQARNRFQKKNKDRQVTVTEEDIAAVVSEWTKIPVQKLAESESERLRKLEKTLHKRVIGQDEAVTAVAKAVRRGRVGLKDPNRPIGSFLFLGPTGVGKTELSKALAEALFGDENAMIRVDMSEYMEKHSVSKMIGSPPGYVGHDDGGQLSEQVRRHPYSVVLFDEIEKAHPDVFNILLQVLDDGHITDAHGRKVDFKQTIIIMTSNVGAQAIIEPKKLGFMSEKDDRQDYERMKSGVMEEVRRLFKPEFLNRIDEIMVFHPLKKPEIKKIVNILLKNLEKRCEEQLGIELKISESVKDYLAESGFDSKYGARPLRRAIQNRLEDPMTNKILDGGIKTGDTVKIQLLKKEIHFVPVREEKETKAKSKKDVKS